MGLFTVGLRDDDFEPAYNDVPDRRDGGRINPYHDRINAQKSCRRMEKT
ncbi:restriction endonuclease, partial [Bifidobacterium pseudocatenulatum]|nr:restriction endonuclease [Bifidobacterium pseudocatenulatum]